MEIELQHIGKKYHRDWIFKSMTMSINAGDQVALLGGNGSGKSTLIKVLSGYLAPTEGLIIWRLNQKPLPLESIHTHLSMCAPYQAPFPELTLRENFEFYASFKKMQGKLDAESFAHKMELSGAIDKLLRDYSSGMLQRVKLGLAILTDAPLLLLDEPTSHLDKQAQQWYVNLLLQYSKGKTTFIATNELEKEVPHFTKTLSVQDFKP